MNYAHPHAMSVIRLVLITSVLLSCYLTLWCQNTKSGIASFYHDSLEGNKTASGDVFRQDKFTAAHKKLPLGTWVILSDRNDHQVVVRINDRLPRNSSRMIDLTTRAAKELKMINLGLKRVQLRVISVREAWMWYVENGFLSPDVMWR